ncbi:MULTISPECIES: BlaI/MecI/CopY family transcriptional regulator [unclassified Oceanispirochaeta]|uniref:BlaI/MecI/CopY family transcriptional regulator n=1 Tax=unclassified Oceanispirochaeta TaxID=2635722 RepID=UPI000E099083|nr:MULTISPECIES: BlaI/MecI/CopY family transcriptional regulator [unclassified Oceanispirochaeta]MBF9015662.1 BlaI/MecI/CopY family transcriptional regulator [Oceanispirochaeta sp. M2]NPD73436.1 BlaI/MecI/CopY family transcriptional regulator [Oceanispirochaeta sp. M1]RDG30909.1 BlaI/MecI/CopY family transcriptional regulator [Oceanispirochaeta sp. M1]
MKRLTELESKILKIIWKLGSRATVNQILESWEEDKTPQYTTILKTLQIMEQKKLIDHEKNGRSYTYFPLVSKNELSINQIKNLVSIFFGNNKVAMATTLINYEKLNKEEINELKALIDKKEQELKDE